VAILPVRSARRPDRDREIQSSGLRGKPMPGAVLDACLQLRFLDDPPQVLGVAGGDLIKTPAAVLAEMKLRVECGSPDHWTRSLQRAFLISSSKIAAVTTTSKAARWGEIAPRSYPGKGVARPRLRRALDPNPAKLSAIPPGASAIHHVIDEDLKDALPLIGSD
jgi:hypothetical protein